MSVRPRQLIGVVDDDARILEALQDLIESAGYRVVLYHSASALLASNIFEIDCLITDVAMPGMDGFALRARVRQLRPTLPVFLLSGRHESSADEHGEAGFFRKPFDGSTLLAAIDAALNRRD